MTIKIDTAKDRIDIYNAETGQVAETTPHAVVESSLAQGTGIVLTSSSSTGKVTVALDPAALGGGGGGTVNINGLTSVSTDGVTITGNGASTPLVAHATAVADNNTIKGDGSVASPFYAPGAAAVYEYTIANGVSSFQSDSMAPYKTVLFSVTNLATSWGLWPVANNLDAAAMGFASLSNISGLSGIPRGTTANILLDMAGAQVNMLANTLNQFINGAAFGRLEKMTVRFGNESAAVSRWFGSKSVPTSYDIGSDQTTSAASGSPTLPWAPSFSNLGPFTEYTDVGRVLYPIAPDKVNVGGIDSFMQGMTGNAFRLRTVYHNNNMNPGAITPFGTFVSGTVRLVCYK